MKYFKIFFNVLKYFYSVCTQGKSHRKKVRDQETQKFFCEDCNVTCANQAIFETHIRGKQHAKKREQGEDRVEGDMNVELTILFSISKNGYALKNMKPF